MTTALYDALRELRHALLVAFVGLFGAGYLDQEANKRVIGAAREAEAVVSVGEGGDVLGEVDAVGDVLAVEALVFEGLPVRTGGFEPPHPCGYWDLNPARLPDSATSASPVRVARGGGASGSEDGVALECPSSRQVLAGPRVCQGPECVSAVVFV